MRPLIVTARLDEEAQSYFNEMRQRHFPPERNQLAAHLTLFHALPGSNEEAIALRLRNTAQGQAILHGKTTGLRSLGRGVAFAIECGELSAVRAELASTWHSFLTPQDRQSWRPHITIQNKVDPATARKLLQQLGDRFESKPIRFTGLDLWHYNGGPWELAESYLFSVERAGA